MIIFPPSIAQGDKNRPVVIFRNEVIDTGTDTHIVFPIPQSFQFNDSASYNNSEIGFTGSLVIAGASGSGGSAIKKSLESAIPKDVSSLAQLFGAAATTGRLESAISVASGTTLNKNIVTEFTGVATRTFTFQFKMMTTSETESNIAKQITNIFRLSMYPEGNNLQLKFPARWYINFKQGANEIDYIPKIFECYLTGVSTAYNSSTSMFHPDGSPVEIDLTLNFMESRALTKHDIRKLEVTPFADGDFTFIAEVPESSKTISMNMTSDSTEAYV